MAIVIYFIGYLIFRRTDYFVDEWGAPGDDGIISYIILIDDSKTIGGIGWIVFWPLEKLEGTARGKLIIRISDLDDPKEVIEFMDKHQIE